MSEDTYEATMAEAQAHLEAGHHDGGVEEIEGLPPRISATPGMPERRAAGRHRSWVREVVHTWPPTAQAAILEELDSAELPAVTDSVTTAVRHQRPVRDARTQPIATGR
jgi:phospholipid/cholesterol/gamma-HCH transport system ATP-binding protein